MDLFVVAKSAKVNYSNNKEGQDKHIINRKQVKLQAADNKAQDLRWGQDRRGQADDLSNTRDQQAKRVEVCSYRNGEEEQFVC